MIEVKDLCVSLGGRRVVDGVSLSARAGDFIALTGPNGAGKSTALKAMAGILTADDGSVSVDGSALTGLDVRERAQRLAWLPQTRPVAWNLRAEDVVALGRFVTAPGGYDQLGPADKAEVDAALGKADARHLAGRAFQTLSGGEQARVHLARLLASPAPCLLLDEPCAALDVAHQIDLMETLAAEAARGRCVIVVLHDLTLAARHCARVAVMNGGRLVADGPPETALDAGVLARVFGVSRGPGGDFVRAEKPPR